MGIGVSIFLITLGAIFKFAITVRLSGVDLEAIGVILMVVGAASLVLQMIFLGRSRVVEERELMDEGQGGPPPV